MSDSDAYKRITGAFRKHRNGITFADVAADTGLSLNRVKTLVPLAADEYSARLEVTESGEILYSFPRGWRSRYRGPVPAAKKFLSLAAGFAAKAGKLLFKVWIMVMLLGYFLLFMAIALASVFISVAGNSRSSGRRGGGVNVSFGFFHLIMRLWFYSELFGARRSYGAWGGGTLREGKSRESRPLHKAIFSFVFGDEDPNADWETALKKAFISYLRRRRGVVSLPELMTMAGLCPEKAESFIAGLCAEFSGSPEVTGEGTIVYRFDEILLSGEKQSGDGVFPVSAPPSPLPKKTKGFSSNPKKMNVWFGIINGVNLLFGSYFLYNAASIGNIMNEAVLRSSGMYGIVYYFLFRMGIDALPVIRVALGLVPLLFSALFWLIPAVRSAMLRKENNAIRMDNFRGWGFGRIWTNPQNFRPADLDLKADEYRPAKPGEARDMVIREMSRYSAPLVAVDENKNEVFDFPELGREKDALEKYRLAINKPDTPGKTIFDSGA